jgi:ABC-2 type transport system permease protein
MSALKKEPVKGEIMNLVCKSFCALMQRDLVIFFATCKDRLINALVWGILTVIVFEYIMPEMGMQGMGSFMASGAIASWGFAEVTENISRFIADLEGERSISYYLTLPIPQWAVFVRLALSNAFQALFIAAFFIPLFKLILWHSFPLDQLAPFKFTLIFLVTHLFYGFFSLCLGAQIKSLDLMGNVWMRIVFPLWWVGCYQFTFKALHQAHPWIAYVNLLNPIVYIFEGTRAALIGQEGYLNFWLCFIVLTVMTIIVALFGIKKLQKRLDCL